MEVISKGFIIIAVAFVLSSCIIDIDDEKPTFVDARSIEEIMKGFDISSYRMIKDTVDFPLIAWVGVTNSNLTLNRFEELKNSGITINTSRYRHVDSVQKALDLAHQVGVKILIDCPEVSSSTVQMVKRFKDHPANAGYFLVDEPSVSQILSLKKLVNEIESIDNSRFCYINLLPNYVSSEQLNAPNYESYIERFINEIPLKVLSFDHYPIVGNHLRFNWYQNLEIIRNEANKASIPFWAFVMTTAHNAYPITDLNQMRLQVYSNLAYGAKGIQYFTYWTPSIEDYRSGPIERDGTRTVVYDYLKKMNAEIKALSYIFLSSEVVNVTHFGNDIPEGTAAFQSPPSNIKSLKIREGNALISELKNNSNRFFMIQNNNLLAEIAVKIETSEATKLILKNGSIIPASIIKEEFKLTPGDIVIFMD
ncbi:MAG: hypothetical protein VB074_03760 [Proteiniphilum sp.]|uniref:hypothetical protein n=1 Tax=Proteiniphilum sp. TaxID=1926877 RepID=UPI002B21D981|nr:hypothetical protein [Proteiniphilum sp.]MEA5127275.1 hypothetical protein [Proteiniphilum sp.]